jgi:two-component system alkaline phosphatase synthesis response regulator PhoP
MSASTPMVLIAEDNFVLARVLKFNLERAGCQVSVVHNGADAVRLLREQRYDLLLTDHQMPQVSGGELCRIVRQDLGLADLPIVMCSAKGLELDVERLRTEYQLMHLFFKPFSVRDIVALVSEVLTFSSSSQGGGI